MVSLSIPHFRIRVQGVHVAVRIVLSIPHFRIQKVRLIYPPVVSGYLSIPHFRIQNEAQKFGYILKIFQFLILGYSY